MKIITLGPINLFPAYGLLCCLFSLLAGCATLTDKTTAVSTVVIEPAAIGIAAPANFELAGRVSVRDGKQSFSGGVRWHHTNASDEILLLSPLGQTVAQIQRNPEGVQLTTSEQKVYRAADVESLTGQVLGWRLPLMGLQYWVRGDHSPATSAVVDKDGEGRVIAIRQDGWEITYSSFFPLEPAHLTQATRPADAARSEVESGAKARYPPTRCEAPRSSEGQDECSRVAAAEAGFAGNESARPRSLALQRGELEIRLVVDNWEESK